MRAHLSVLLAACAPAWAQCVPGWSALGAGCNWEVLSIEVDPFAAPGSSRIFVAGYFGAAGGVPAHSLAAWDGREWSTAIGQVDTINGHVDDGLAVDASHPPIEPGYYIGGAFHSVGGVGADFVARRDAAAWNPLGAGAAEYVLCLGNYDENGAVAGGSAMYAGGAFAEYQGQPANSLVRWDGAQWVQLSPILNKPAPTVRPEVFALAAFDDDGPGPRRPGLYVGGSHKGAGAIVSRNVIRWDGTQWEDLNGGLTGTVESLCGFDDDGPGPRRESLFAGGSFSTTTAGLPAFRIARWDGTVWSAVPEVPVFTGPRDMLVWDSDAAGPLPPMLFITGPGYVIRWRGLGYGYQYLDGGNIGGGVGSTYGECLGVWDEDGPGPNPGGLYVGGNFSMAGAVPANFIARWGCPLPPGGPCYPDCNQDGTLNLADFGCFTTKFATADPYADCNSDGVRDLADFGCFQTRFALGCP